MPSNTPRVEVEDGEESRAVAAVVRRDPIVHARGYALNGSLGRTCQKRGVEEDG